ncbi:MAG: hypothetical protein UY74_C0012G0009 [Candidatus Kaiserbacteria bacterium GW2011_GWC2_52_8b]|uniref:Uncharacterized protein n=2 Tax=Candidatus Kaiseribacteriota TaxID=1752734 RepID=A0A0G1XKU2_9BACT|nr:MAG: hypothetical protein UY67_C0029G0009 [Candidatus Kaiserbacteria bacterium GW2011_GWA2_52_12]KKW31521.1 MAG: hypothetical protein UY74_C0012G0009 [Candidatus Kaiserbacteria bacterium GW2011_GWC2_52_8b]
MRPVLFLIGIIGLFISIWLTLVAAIILVVRYPAWEVLILGLLVDFLWLPSGLPLSHLPLATLAAIMVVWAFEPLRSEFLIR